MFHKSGDFVIEMCSPKLNGNMWFCIWGETNGEKCAAYLRQCVENENREGVEYRMLYIK